MAGAAAIIGPPKYIRGSAARGTPHLSPILGAIPDPTRPRPGEVSSLLPGVLDRVLPDPDEQLIDLLDMEKDSPNLVHSPPTTASSNGPSLSIWRPCTGRVSTR